VPIFEYRCECGYEAMEVQMIGEESPKCEKCGGDMIKKVSSPAIIRFKGDGGYPVRSKGYKEGYSKEYLKDNPSTEA